jgi:glycosyltransferase involved in cell wall biosynthesis
VTSLRVLQICHDFPPSLGGGATHVYSLSKGLTQLGHRVQVMTTDLIGKGQRTPVEREEMDGISIRRFRATMIPGVGADVGNIPLGMLSAALGEHPDIVHVHTYRFFSTWLVPILRSFKRVPVLMTSHSAYEPSRPARIRLFDATWGKLIFQSVSHIIALTDIEKKYLVSLGAREKDITIIPNGVDPYLLDYQPNVERFKKQFGLENERIVLFVGRIGLGKGLDILIDAIPHVLSQVGNSVRFVLVGPDWGDQTMLEQRAQSLGVSANILFAGSLTDDALLDAYHAADVFALLSRFDASPLVLLESMAASKPIVATRVGGIPSMITNDANGLLVESENVNQAADAIASVLVNASLAQRLGQAGKNLVQERYRWDKIASQVSAMYTRVLGQV